MEKIYKHNPNVGWYHTADTNSLDLFPRELSMIQEIVNGKFAVIDTWHGQRLLYTKVIDDRREVEITDLAGKTIATKLVQPEEAVHICIRRSGANISTITLPRLLNDKVRWALGAKRYQRSNSLEELQEYQCSYQDPCDDHAVRYDYGKCHAVVVRDWKNEVRDGRYFIDGFLARDEAVEILKKAIQLDGWFFSYPAKIQYVLDNI